MEISVKDRILQYAESISLFEKAFKINSNNYSTVNEIANVYFHHAHLINNNNEIIPIESLRKRKFKQLLEKSHAFYIKTLYQMGIDINNDSQLSNHYFIAQLYYDVDNYPAALEHFKIASKMKGFSNDMNDFYSKTKEKFKKMPKLRFAIGDRVQCKYSGDNQWKEGTVVKHYYRESSSFPMNLTACYQVCLDLILKCLCTGRCKCSPTYIYVMHDDDEIMKSNSQSNSNEANNLTKCQYKECSKKDEINVVLKLCSRCNLVKYCSRECQVADYPLHKRVCKKLK